MANKVIPTNMPHPVSMVGWDGTDFRIALVDALHHLQVDILSGALPTGAATEATLAEVSARIGDETGPAAGSLNELLRVIETDLASLMPYDRGLTKVVNSYGATLAAHGMTIRYTYTVPANRIALLETVFLRCTPPDAGHVGVVIIEVNGVVIVNLAVDPLSTTFPQYTLNWSGAVWLPTGSIVRVLTYSNSGGNVSINADTVFSEFNV